MESLLPRPLSTAAPATPGGRLTRLLPTLIGAAVGAATVMWADAWLPVLAEWSWVGLLGVVALIAVSVWLHVLLHEAGHALVGLAVGFRPVAFGVGPLRAERGAQGWRLRWGGSVQGISGFALLLPPADAPPSLAHQAWYLLGGPLSNLLFAALAFLLLPVVAEQAWAQTAVAVFLLMGLAIGLINLMPFEAAGWLSDGANLRLLHRDPGAVLAGLRVQRIVQTSMDGLRPRDWPAELVEGGPLPTLPVASPWQVASVLMRLSRAVDAGALVEAAACAQWLANYWPSSKPPERPGIALTMAVYAALAVDDAATSLALLAAWRPLGNGESLLDQRAHEAWLDAELAWREGRLDAARSHLAEARAALPRIHDQGTRIAVAERLDWLAETVKHA
jgi:hypothetical protein